MWDTRPVPREFAEVVRPVLEESLHSGDSLLGIVAVVAQSTFRGSLYALGVTQRELILQPLDRHLRAKAEPTRLGFSDLAGAEARAGEPWWSAQIVDVGAITLKLRASDGSKLKLKFMPGGEGLLGGLGGGDSQAQGVNALAGWMRERESRD